MVSALVSGSSGPGSSLAGDIELCSWARHLTLTVPLSTQAMDWHPIQGGVEILLAASCH